MDYTRPIMWGYIHGRDKKSVKDLFDAIISSTEIETKKIQFGRRRSTYLAIGKG